MASVVLELLKKLVMEFKDELDALGVKVDSLDKRVAVLEENLGGWKLYGELYFDANFYDRDGSDLDSDFGFGRARFYLTKQIDENTSMLLRMNIPNGEFTWDRLYVDTKLPWDIDFRFGRLNFDWEGDLGLYDPYTINNDGTFGDWTLDGFQFAKTWGMFNATAVVGRNVDYTFGANIAGYEDADENNYATLFYEDSLNVALKLGANGENWMLGAMAYWTMFDNGRDNDFVNIAGVNYGYLDSINTYGVYGGYSFTPAIQLKGVYYWQDIDATLPADIEDSPTSWKVILDVKQDLLKFTSLWIEYAQQDNTFIGTNSYDYMGGNEMGNYRYYDQLANSFAESVDPNGTAEIFNIIANQQWNDKWSTYIRYWLADWDSANVDDTENWTFGIRYQYTPAIQFKLEYDMIDYGHGNQTIQGDDNVIRFRTTVNF